MFRIGEELDGKYRVTGICSNSGGMGGVLHVEPIGISSSGKIVLKYCREMDAEYLARFRREVRISADFRGSKKVVEIIDFNLTHDPPYFIMPFYHEGDLSSRPDRYFSDPGAQEATFFQMIDCIKELHDRGVYHRDIKPQNFLIDGDKILVSDLGLSAEIASDTRMTRSSASWGTPEYIPPEFLNGGDFKNATPASDIFMLGKTIYYLLTGKNAMYLEQDGLHSAIFHVIERACNPSKSLRYQSLSETKQSLSAAYDVVLSRAGTLGKVKQMLLAIEDLVRQEKKYRPTDVKAFIEGLSTLDKGDQAKLCKEFSSEFFDIISQKSISDILETFLTVYERMVTEGDYGWSYAEIIAYNMKMIFLGDVSNQQKSHALELAIIAAIKMNRFAAMDTCSFMIKQIQDETLGFLVGSMLERHYNNSFLTDIEQSEIQSDVLRAKMKTLGAGENTLDS